MDYGNYLFLVFLFVIYFFALLFSSASWLIFLLTAELL